MMTPRSLATALAGQPQKMSQRTFHQKAKKNVAHQNANANIFIHAVTGFAVHHRLFAKHD